MTIDNAPVVPTTNVISDLDLSLRAAETPMPDATISISFECLHHLHRLPGDGVTPPHYQASITLNDLDIYVLFRNLASMPGVPEEVQEQAIDVWWAIKKARLAPPEF